MRSELIGSKGGVTSNVIMHHNETQLADNLHFCAYNLHFCAYVRVCVTPVLLCVSRVTC